MHDLVFIKELLTVVGSVTAILVALGSIILFIIKKSFQRGEGYQLFKSLVEEVSSIKKLIDDKFIHNDAKHREHEERLFRHNNRITVLEVITDVKKIKGSGRTKKSG